MDKVLLVTWSNGERECYTGKHALRDLHEALAELYGDHKTEIRLMSTTTGFLWASELCVGRYEALIAMNVSAD